MLIVALECDLFEHCRVKLRVAKTVLNFGSHVSTYRLVDEFNGRRFILLNTRRVRYKVDALHSHAPASRGERAQRYVILENFTSLHHVLVVELARVHATSTGDDRRFSW